MSKLSLKDVKILGEGPQIRELIYKSYNRLEEFYALHKVTKSYATFISYLSKDFITSESFKCNITLALDADFNSLFLSKKEQIEKHVQDIYDDIREYDQDEDREIFDYLLEECKAEGMLKESAMTYRAKARNYYYTNRIDRCVEHYEYAIEAMPKEEINKKIFFLCELADDMFRENMIADAEKKYKHIQNMIKIHKDRLDNNTLFYYHYWRGIAYMHVNKLERARELYISAREYAPRNLEKAGTIANIGLTYKKQEQYDEALKYYFEALNYPPDETRMITVGLIYNNIAMVYKNMKDYTNALEYVQKALDIAENETDLSYKLSFTETYVDILKEMGKKKVYKIYLDTLRRSKKKRAHKPFMISSILSFIDNNNDKSCLLELADIIIILKKASTNIEYNAGLNECMWNIMVKVRKLDKEGIQ